MEKTKMTLLETTYTQLRDTGLIQNAEAFSADYLGKNRNWFALQKHSKRDFSVSTAVQCLRSVNKKLKFNDLTDEQFVILTEAQTNLRQYLASAYLIESVVEASRNKV